MIEVEDRNGIAWLRLAHGKANALDVELLEALQSELRRQVDGTARAVVLTGRGRTFCAGVDLVRLVGEDEGYIRTLIARLGELCIDALTLPKPLVAALNGHAIAGGCILACLADRRLVERDGGRVGLPELLVGVPFPPEVLELVRASVAPVHFSDIVYGGAAYEPEAARLRGLVDELCDPGTLDERAAAAADALAALDPELFRHTKAQIRAPVVERMRAAREASGARTLALWTAPATRRAVRAYVERTLGR